MKSKIASIIANVIFGAVIGFFIWQRAPETYRLWKMQDEAAPTFQVRLLDDQMMTLPFEGKKLLVVFWATWCGPCSVEMGRIQELINENKIRSEDVIAISSFEDLETVKKYSSEKKYSFMIGYDPEGAVAKLFQVKSTPTLMLLNSDGKVAWMTMGLSPSLGRRLTSHFKP